MSQITYQNIDGTNDVQMTSHPRVDHIAIQQNIMTDSQIMTDRVQAGLRPTEFLLGDMRSHYLGAYHVRDGYNGKITPVRLCLVNGRIIEVYSFGSCQSAYITNQYTLTKAAQLITADRVYF